MGNGIVIFEQSGQNKAEYWEEVIDRLSNDLTAKFGRGFGRSNLFQMRAFYCAYSQIVQTVSGQFENINGKSLVHKKACVLSSLEEFCNVVEDEVMVVA